MSDKSNPLQGLFVNRKGDSKSKSSLTPASKKKNVSKRWWYIGFGVVILAGLSSALFGSKPQPLQAPKPKDQGTIQVTPPNSAQQNFQAQYGQQLQACLCHVGDGMGGRWRREEAALRVRLWGGHTLLAGKKSA
jgi:hypothetical protein